MFLSMSNPQGGQSKVLHPGDSVLLEEMHFPYSCDSGAKIQVASGTKMVFWWIPKSNSITSVFPEHNFK